MTERDYLEYTAVEVKPKESIVVTPTSTEWTRRFLNIQDKHPELIIHFYGGKKCDK